MTLTLSLLRPTAPPPRPAPSSSYKGARLRAAQRGVRGGAESRGGAGRARGEYGGEGGGGDVVGEEEEEVEVEGEEAEEGGTGSEDEEEEEEEEGGGEEWDEEEEEEEEMEVGAEASSGDQGPVREEKVGRRGVVDSGAKNVPQKRKDPPQKRKGPVRTGHSDQKVQKVKTGQKRQNGQKGERGGMTFEEGAAPLFAIWQSLSSKAQEFMGPSLGGNSSSGTGPPAPGGKGSSGLEGGKGSSGSAGGKGSNGMGRGKGSNFVKGKGARPNSLEVSSGKFGFSILE